MRIRTTLVIAVAACAVAGLLPGVTAEPIESLDLSQVRPGQTGRAYTVFEGSEPRPFDVELIGVLDGVRPKGSLILFRALGDSLGRTGIVAGMSGSPVYVEGKLVGAIAFAFPFSKEPIGLITPIEEMMGGIERADQEPAPWMGPRGSVAGDWTEAFLAGDPGSDLWASLVPAFSPPS